MMKKPLGYIMMGPRKTSTVVHLLSFLFRSNKPNWHSPQNKESLLTPKHEIVAEMSGISLCHHFTSAIVVKNETLTWCDAFR
jgi:hypothetical protein